MTIMAKVTARWSGFSGAPGYSNFFWYRPTDDTWTPQDFSDATGAVHALFTMSKSLLPPTVKIDVLGDVELIQDTDGQLMDVQGGYVRDQIVGGALDSPYSAASGAVITWRTGTVKNGRRVRGRTFLVPLANVAYETDGTLNASALSTLQTAAQGMINNSGFSNPCVWSRPSAVGATDGTFAMITSASIPDMGSILKSRRAS